MKQSLKGVLLLIAAAPLFSQTAPIQTELAGLQLGETIEQVRKALGEPLLVADINQEFRSWQYRIGDFDHDDFSHALVFRKSTGTLVSISRIFDAPISVEKWFPAGKSTYHRYPETGNPEMTVRVLTLPKNRLLLAFGSAKPGDKTTQLILMDRSVLPVFYPWLAAQSSEF